MIQHSCKETKISIMSSYTDDFLTKFTSIFRKDYFHIVLNLGDQWIAAEKSSWVNVRNFHMFCNVKSHWPFHINRPRKHIVIWYMENKIYPKGVPSWSMDSVLQNHQNNELVSHHCYSHNTLMLNKIATIHQHRLLQHSYSFIKTESTNNISDN